MNTQDKMTQEVKEFIEDWYWDEKSHQYAQELGQFLFQFLDSLKEEGLTERTIKKHTDNCWFIGSFECGYRYQEEFAAEDVFFSPEASYEYEFSRKVSDSSSALASYRSTWRKIYKYAKKRGLVD